MPSFVRAPQTTIASFSRAGEFHDFDDLFLRAGAHRRGGELAVDSIRSQLRGVDV